MKTRTRYINKLEELGALVNQLSEKTVLDVRAAGRALAGDADAADKVSKMVSLAAKAFSQADAALAQRVFAMDDGVDELYDRCEQVVVDLIRSETQGASHLPELLMVAKYFERMGDDAERIASWAVFRATGEHALNSAGKENAEE